MTSRAYRENYAAIDWSQPVAQPPKAPRSQRRAFHIVKDIEPFISPITGEVIGSRTSRREHMRQHDVIEVGNEKPKPRQPVPLPDVRHDIRIAREMVASGYRPCEINNE